MALVQVAADDFNRADGALGANWLTIGEATDGGALIVSNALRCDGTSPTSAARDGTYRWAGAGSFDNDQFSEVTVVDRRSGQPNYVVLGARTTSATGAANEGYKLTAHPSTGQFRIQKRKSGSNTTLQSTSYVVQNGDVLRFEAIGENPTVLNGYVNDVLMITTEDSSAPLAGGAPSLQLVAPAGCWVVVDGWSAGNVVEGGGSETINLTPDPASVTAGSTVEETITRGTAAGVGGVTYNLASNDTGVATVPASVTMLEGETEVTFDVAGVSLGTATITATNAADSGETDSITVNVTTATVRKLKLLAHIDALGATAVQGAVFAAPAGGALLGALIGEFSGAAFKAVAESGQAPLEVDVADFDGDALTTADTPVCVWEATSAAGSAIAGSPAPFGSNGVHECTVIEVEA